MKAFFSALFILGLMPALSTSSRAQAPADETAPVERFSQEEITQLVSPIALYPDPLVALRLPASTFPSDVVLASRFLDSGEDIALADEKPWDSSVVGLVRYPATLKWMDENLEWTTQLGDAYLTQPEDVMDAIQQLRAQAASVGNLVDTPQQLVVEDDSSIRIVPADPEYIYVPYYDPEIVYYERPLSVPLLTFSVGCEVGPWLRYDFDWHHRRLYCGEWHQGWDYRRDHDRDGHRGDEAFINRHLTNPRVWHGDPGRRLASSHFFAQTRVARERNHSVAQPEQFAKRSPRRDSTPRAIAVDGNASRSPSSAASSHDMNRGDHNSRNRLVMPNTANTPGSGEPGYTHSVAGGGKYDADNFRGDAWPRSHGDGNNAEVLRALPFHGEGNDRNSAGRVPNVPSVVGNGTHEGDKLRGSLRAHSQDGDAARIAAAVAAARARTEVNHSHDNSAGPSRRDLTPRAIAQPQQVSPIHHDVPRSPQAPSLPRLNPVITGHVEHNTPQVRVAPQVQQHVSPPIQQPQAAARIQHSAPQARVAPQMQQHVPPQTPRPQVAARIQHSAPQARVAPQMQHVAPQMPMAAHVQPSAPPPQPRIAPPVQHNAPPPRAPQVRSSPSHGSGSNSGNDDSRKRRH
jgi:hypothetical protein